VAQFRTRARTVDMLGRQQIAGIPTAISELFKNAHDAYADNAIVDFFRSDRLFVLRDDGIGMTEEDYERRWLTLGTESKAAMGGELGPPPKRRGYGTRAILGEKGIGRLAIAAIGPQTLMLSRPLRDDALGDLLVSFVHWGLFELPAANLEDVEIPTVTLPGGQLPTRADVDTLVDWVADNLKGLAARTDTRLAKRIRSELENFRSVAPDELAMSLGTPSLADGPGTHFYIRPASELIATELDIANEGQATPLSKTLVGFSNTMTPDHPPPALATAFRDHYSEDAFDDVISESEFFIPDEFTSADHHIRGIFDEHGQFNGSVAIYGGEDIDYTLAWPSAHGTPTDCGPFRLNLAYVQGELKNSRLEPSLFRELTRKLDHYGGLYIYRDGIRVLPYGNTDYDFLDIEVRRAKSASDAFFSYRRMFGVIEITRRDNGQLREKAGREGFADNEAYREFRAILMEFLRRVAIDFFRETGTLAEPFLRQRTELERLDKARRTRAKQVRPQRADLTQRLELFFARVADDSPRTEVDEILERLKGKLAAAVQREQPDEAARLLLSAEMEARSLLMDVGGVYDIHRPRGIGLTRQLTRDMAAYEAEHGRLVEEIFKPAWQRVEAEVAKAAREHKVAVDRRLRFDSAVEASARRSTDTTRRGRRGLEEAARDARGHAQELARKSLATVESNVEDVLSRAARLDVTKLSDREFVRQRTALEEQLDGIAGEQAQALGSVTDQLAAIVWPTNGSEPTTTHLDEIEAMETDLEALRDQVENDLELTQLGMAVEVINHEFQGTVRSIRRSLQRIKGWSDANPGLREPYRDLRTSFDHLDGYLKLFTPLQRRLYRSKVEISGAEIWKFLCDVFEKRIEDAGVTLAATDSFSDHRVWQYPSTIYPVFINLVDNAIWWLTDYRGEKLITLDANSATMSVRDSGPGISSQHREAVFEAGFTLKPGGSGYGLHISREVLAREGMSLELVPGGPDAGAEFVIHEDDKST
jgi:signal transduction histidine kinase